MTPPKSIFSPLNPADIQALRAGDRVLLSGTIYTARDAAHQRLTALLDRGEPWPVELRGQTVYYAGPCPAPPGRIIGSAGPTTAGRMDGYAPRMIAEGLSVMIGKGDRSPKVIEAIQQYQGLYLAAAGGAGALLAGCVTESRIVAFPDLGPEAIYALTIKDMPLWAAIDCHGGSIYARIRPDVAGEEG